MAGDTVVKDSKEAWLTLIAAFIAMFTVLGVAYSFGAFFKPMSEQFGTSRGVTSFVFSITACLWFMLSVFTGRAVDRRGPRPVLAVGAIVMGTGLLLTSQANDIWVAYVTYGVGVGVGVACGFIPMMAVVGRWFQRRRAMALGIAVSGNGIGTVAVAPLAATLIDAHGWRTTYIVFAIGSTALLAAAAVLIRPPPLPPAHEEFDFGAVVRSHAFRSLYVSNLLLALALFVPFVFLPGFSEDQGTGRVAAAALISVIGAASVLGRLAMGVVGDRLGSVRALQLCFLVSAASFVIWLPSSAYLAMVAFAIVMGVGYGGVVALAPAVAADLFGVHSLGRILGAVNTATGIGVLLGPPLAGAIIDGAGYRWGIAAALALAAAGFGAIISLPSGTAGGGYRSDVVTTPAISS